MRKLRWVLLAALVVTIAVVVAGFYRNQKRNLAQAPAPPAPLPAEVGSTAANWSWSQSTKDRLMFEVRAQHFRQIRDSSRLELGEVELKIYRRAGDSYNLIRSKKAEFDQPAERLYSEGEVTIVLGLPADQAPQPGKRYVTIRTSRLTYDNKSGTASTDSAAAFEFQEGAGRAIGTVYDSANRYLWLKSEVEVVRRPAQASAPPMVIRAGELHYYEAEQKVELKPWSSIERGGQGVRAAASTVFLDSGLLTKIEAHRGQGWDRSGSREVRFGGDWMELQFTTDQTVSSATGIGSAEFESRSATGSTHVTGGRVDLEFVTPAGAPQSQLAGALVQQQARVENTPAAVEGKAPHETRLLTAESVKLVMRPGGEDIQSIETVSAGRLQMLPRQAGQWKRTLTAERISASYQPGNRLETLRALGAVYLRSEPPQAGSPPRLTWSDDLQAAFDPESGRMRELRQWSNFRYQEGDRQARAGGARFELESDRIHLDTAARVWDNATQTAADYMVLNQKEDQFHAEGHVSSSHLPAERPGTATAKNAPPEALFSSDRPVHATAARMDSQQGRRLVHYRGAARLWQDGNSIVAQEIDLDREAHTLSARGGVMTVLVEDEKPGAKGGRPLTTISADSLLYTDENRRAYYTGNVELKRGNLTVHSAELEAFLRPRQSGEKTESRLERAVATGRVEIEEAATNRGEVTRRAKAERADYTTADERVVLSGGAPTIEQPGRGSTRGVELTYYIHQDRLQVSGGPGAPSESRHRLQRR